MIVALDLGQRRVGVALADAEGYRSLWIATAVAAGLGVLATLRLRPVPLREPMLE